MRARLLALGSFAAALTTATLGAAQPSRPTPSLDVRGFRMSTDPAAGLYYEPATSPGTLEYNVGLYGHYGYGALSLRDAAGGVVRPVEHQLTGDLVANVGIAKRLAIGLDLPVLLFQGGTFTPAAAAALGTTGFAQQAVGDLGVGLKLTLIPPLSNELGGFALALHQRLGVPTGAEDSLLGEGAVTSETRLLAEYRYVFVGLHLAAGVKLRAEEGTIGCAAVGTSSPACVARFGHEIPYGLALTFKPQVLGIDKKGRTTWFVETHGYVPFHPQGMFSSDAASSAQLGLGMRYTVRDVSMLAGVETALAHGVGNAGFRGTLGLGWAPRSHDKDNDGVEDDVDECKDLPEDRDGFQDTDGCPELDNDDDGVPDRADKCPKEKEDEDGFQDDDGCPDKDDDGDGVADSLDRCPREKGLAREGNKNGCPVKDGDGDGVEDVDDKCPAAKEDVDGFEDGDGCPELDNDGDGVPDERDACRDVAGVAVEGALELGCPDPDPDGDGLLDKGDGLIDKCPKEAEDYDGVDDDDGCPDAGKAGAPLAAERRDKTGLWLELTAPLELAGDGLAPRSASMARAIAALLKKSPTLRLDVGVQPAPKREAEAAERAKQVAEHLKKLVRRDVVRVVLWDDVKKQKNAKKGVGLALREVPAPTPAAKKAE